MSMHGKVRGLSAILATIWMIACGSNNTTGTGGTGGKPSSDGGAGGLGGGSSSSGTGGQKPVSCTGNTDPDCECVDGTLQGKDADGDGEFSRACAKAPGKDCDDGDAKVTSNACGGCSDLGANKGEACLECGVLKCDGEENLVCEAPNKTTRRCAGATSAREICVSGQWKADDTCTGATPACLDGACVTCTPGSISCVLPSSAVSYEAYTCGTDGNWGATPVQCGSFACDAANGGCQVTGAFHPRDRDFELPIILRDELKPEDGAFGELLNIATGLELG